MKKVCDEKISIYCVSSSVVIIIGQCLNRKIHNVEKIMSEVEAWQTHRENKDAKVNWQFTANDTRINLSRLYPSIKS